MFFSLKVSDSAAKSLSPHCSLNKTRRLSCARRNDSGGHDFPMAKLSTHVLDTMHGCPAAGVALELFVIEAAGPRRLVTAITNADGRTDAPLLSGDAVKKGRYRLVFKAGDYFRARGVKLPEFPFVDVVTVDFGLGEDGGSYHVPLVCTPWTYSTYRGS